jgi:SAM-dependent methyltransferase
MNEEQEKLLTDYIQSVKRASSEAAKSRLFLSMMERLFPSLNIGYIEEKFPELEKFISYKSKTVVAKGRIDSLLGNVIIEFEKDANRMKLVAEEQIKKYVAILWNNELKEVGKKTSYIGIITDGIQFYLYRPETVKEKDIKEEDVQLIKIEEFNIEKRKFEEVHLWLDITFLSKEMRTPTTEEFRNTFGVGSVFYSGAFNEIKKAVEIFKKENSETFETLFYEWSKYLSVAYGSTVENVDFFAKHTYLSMLAKLMIYSFFSKGEVPISEETILEILTGKVFERWQIKNFFEEDFFCWITREPVRKIGIKIAKDILSILAKYDLTKINEDILKGLYENLLDEKERHDLGEVYTPDWLAEYMLRELLPNNPEASVLDPSCGSGTFLFIAIKLKKELLKNRMNNIELLYHILENVKGIDIHPLAVLIAKTNYLIALGDLLKTKRHEIIIPIYMADSIRLIDEDKSTLEGIQVYKIPTIDDKTFFFLPCDFIEKRILSPEAIDLLIDLTKELSEEFLKTGEIYKERIEEFLYKYMNKDEAKKYVNILVQNVKIFAEKIIKRNKDTIWGYILKNKHKPLEFTYRKFDIIVGNPPWIAYKFISSVDYQNFLVKMIVNEYALTSYKMIKVLEVATLFFVRCSELYLKDNGIISFVLPKSIFSSDQHSTFRKGAYKKPQLKITKIIDLEGVNPLFNVPACVTFAKKGNKTSYPILLETIEGKLERKNEIYKNALQLLHISRGNLYLSEIGDRSFLSHLRIEFKNKSSYYEKFFEGAHLIPRSFWFVEIETQELGFDYQKPPVKTSRRAIALSKKPWDIILSGNIENEFLYKTVLSSDLFPFSYRTSTVVLPIKPIDNKFKIIELEEASKKFPLLANWLEKVERIWKEKRGEKLKKFSIYEVLDYFGNLSKQDLNKNYVVMYSSSGSIITSCVIDKRKFDKKFVADTSVKVYETNNEDEAYYLTSIFNSSIINNLIKPMQAKGLFGERSIHKKVLELPIPQFERNNKLHIRLSELGKEASKKAQQKLEEILENEYKHLEYLKPQHIARIRKEIREEIKKELEEIDEIVEKILKEIPESSKELNKFITKRS